MIFILKFCPELNIFELDGPMGTKEALTEPELDRRLGDNETLMQWKEFARQNPNVGCQYDMLPPSNEEK